jgi:hypothetical protein
MIKISKNNIIYNEDLVESMFVCYFGLSIEEAKVKIKDFHQYMMLFQEVDFTFEGKIIIYGSRDIYNINEQMELNKKSKRFITFVGSDAMEDYHVKNKDNYRLIREYENASTYLYMCEKYLYIKSEFYGDMIVKIAEV